jgi:hypothetical protein
MVECQLKGFCYNCDEKYFPGHTCKEQKLFMAIFEDVSEAEVEAPPMAKSPDPTDLAPPTDHLEVELVISLNDLPIFSTPKTFKLIGFIKH